MLRGVLPLSGKIDELCGFPSRWPEYGERCHCREIGFMRLFAGFADSRLPACPIVRMIQVVRAFVVRFVVFDVFSA